MYVDETPFEMRHETVYAWIFTNGEEVVSMYRKTREGDFLKELLKDFTGVVVSDFFPIYYSLECPQFITGHLLASQGQCEIEPEWINPHSESGPGGEDPVGIS